MIRLNVFKLGVLFYLFIFLNIQVSTNAQSIDDIYFGTENYPPYNFQNNEKLQGIAVDLLNMIFVELKSKKTINDINMLPWTRGYSYILKKKNSCLFSTTRTSQRENLFKWVGPITSTTISLISKNDRNIVVNAISDLSKYIVGVVKEDVGEQLLKASKAKPKKYKTIYGKDATRKAIKSLNNGTIDIWAYEQNVAMWDIKANGFDTKDYSVAYELQKGELYYAFHKETSEVIIKKMQKALDSLKSQGKHQVVVDKYLK